MLLRENEILSLAPFSPTLADTFRKFLPDDSYENFFIEFRLLLPCSHTDDCESQSMVFGCQVLTFISLSIDSYEKILNWISPL